MRGGGKGGVMHAVLGMGCSFCTGEEPCVSPSLPQVTPDPILTPTSPTDPTRGYHWLARQPWRGDGGALLVQRTRSTPAMSLPGQGLHIEVLHLDAGGGFEGGDESYRGYCGAPPTVLTSVLWRDHARQGSWGERIIALRTVD